MSTTVNSNDAKRDLYKELGVESTVTEAELKKAFRKLAVKYHPDNCDDPGAEEHFQKLSSAYTILSDAASRRDYDARRRGGYGGYSAGTGGGFGSGMFDFGIDAEAIKEQRRRQKEKLDEMLGRKPGESSPEGDSVSAILNDLKKQVKEKLERTAAVKDEEAAQRKKEAAKKASSEKADGDHHVMPSVVSGPGGAASAAANAALSQARKANNLMDDFLTRMGA